MPGFGLTGASYTGPPSGAAGGTPESAYPWRGPLSGPIGPAWVPGGYTFDSVKGRYVKTPKATGNEAADVLTGFQQGGGPESLKAIFGTGDWSVSGSGGYPGGTNPFTAGSSSVPAYQYGAGAGGNVPKVADVAPVDTTAAHAAAFARAKDEAAQTAQASMRALQGTLAARGMGGAGYE